MRKILIAILIVLICGYGLFRVIRARNFQFFGELISRVETDEKVIALTFDDAPTKYLDEVLQIMKDEDTVGTFYVIGRNEERNPGGIQKIMNDGHEVGNHSYIHPRFAFKSMAFIKDEVDKTNTIIRNSGYSDEITFRPPYGQKFLGLPWYLDTLGMKTIMWDVEPDTFYKNTEDKIKYTLEKTRPGSIILLHPFCSTECKSDREMLPVIIQGLKKQGYRFVTISELLDYRNK